MTQFGVPLLTILPGVKADQKFEWSWRSYDSGERLTDNGNDSKEKKFTVDQWVACKGRSKDVNKYNRTGSDIKITG